MHIAGNQHVHLTPKMSLNNISVIKTFAEAGLGIVQVHDYVVEKSIKKGLQIEILPKLSTPNVPVYVYYQKHLYVQPKVRHFIILLPKNYN